MAKIKLYLDEDVEVFLVDAVRRREAMQVIPDSLGDSTASDVPSGQRESWEPLQNCADDRIGRNGDFKRVDLSPERQLAQTFRQV